jgi:hypothetical protein
MFGPVVRMRTLFKPTPWAVASWLIFYPAAAGLTPYVSIQICSGFAAKSAEDPQDRERISLRQSPDGALDREFESRKLAQFHRQELLEAHTRTVLMTFDLRPYRVPPGVLEDDQLTGARPARYEWKAQNKPDGTVKTTTPAF